MVLNRRELRLLRGEYGRKAASPETQLQQGPTLNVFRLQNGVTIISPHSQVTYCVPAEASPSGGTVWADDRAPGVYIQPHQTETGWGMIASWQDADGDWWRAVSEGNHPTAEAALANKESYWQGIIQGNFDHE